MKSTASGYHGRNGTSSQLQTNSVTNPAIQQQTPPMRAGHYGFQLGQGQAVQGTQSLTGSGGRNYGISAPQVNWPVSHGHPQSAGQRRQAPPIPTKESNPMGATSVGREEAVCREPLQEENARLLRNLKEAEERVKNLKVEKQQVEAAGKTQESMLKAVQEENGRLQSRVKELEEKMKNLEEEKRQQGELNMELNQILDEAYSRKEGESDTTLLQKLLTLLKGKWTNFMAHPIPTRALLGGQGGSRSLPKGLPNLGNTCYMGSILQCLFNMYEFRSYFLNDQYKESLCPGNSLNAQVVKSVAKIFKALHYKVPDISTPLQEFKEALEKYDPQFAGRRQQEAHDFLSVLLPCLHEALINVEDPVTSLGVSHVSVVFQGVRESFTTCLKFNKVLSDSTEPFFSLSLPVPNQQQRLEDLLMRHFREQTIEWECDRCHTSHNCRHTSHLLQAPSVLIIHLSRFTQAAVAGLKTLVQYPDTLKIASYPESRQQIWTTFSLAAVCHHRGTVTEGHYTASCRKFDEEQWYLYHDESVTKQGHSHHPEASAHILFYRALKEKQNEIPNSSESRVVVGTPPSNLRFQNFY